MLFTIYNLVIIIVNLPILAVLLELIAANFFEINLKRRYKNKRASSIIPESEKQAKIISVVIPAYNEEDSLRKCVMSVLRQDWLYKQIIVVNDGSQDKTACILAGLHNEFLQSSYMQAFFSDKITLNKRFCIVQQQNSGKSKAINNAVRNYAIGDYVMILDADSLLAPHALTNMVQDFIDTPQMLACASNVQIKQPHRLIDYIQQLEYLISYRLKFAEALCNMEYIIGGVGSTFKKKAMLDVGLYDTDSLTEDLDFTMKLIKYYGNKLCVFGFANNVIAWTPAVHKYNQLYRQRYRWKFGLIQSFFKHYKILFNSNRDHYSRTLCYWMLPKTLIDQLLMLLSPFFLSYILCVADSCSKTMIRGVVFLSCLFLLITVSIVQNANLPIKAKLKLFLLSPLSFLMLLVSIVIDFLVLVKCTMKLSEIKKGSQKIAWEHVDR